MTGGVPSQRAHNAESVSISTTLRIKRRYMTATVSEITYSSSLFYHSVFQIAWKYQA